MSEKISLFLYRLFCHYGGLTRSNWHPILLSSLTLFLLLVFRNYSEIPILFLSPIIWFYDIFVDFIMWIKDLTIYFWVYIVSIYFGVLLLVFNIYCINYCENYFNSGCSKFARDMIKAKKYYSNLLNYRNESIISGSIFLFLSIISLFYGHYIISLWIASSIYFIFSFIRYIKIFIAIRNRKLKEMEIEQTE